MKVVVNLHRNYETEKHVRFDEDEDDEKKLGSLYIRSATDNSLGNPDEIKVTLESKGGE